jgi:alpha-D-xyloside xylohydrolase
MARTHEVAPFLGVPTPVEFVARLDDVRVDGAAVVMTCGTDRHEPALQNYYGTECETVLAMPTSGEPATVRVDFWAPDVLRFRYASGHAVPATPVAPLIGGPAATSPMVIGSPAPGVGLEVQEGPDDVIVRSSAVELVIRRDPWQVVVRDHGGRVLWATKPVDIDGLRLARNQWNPPEQRWLFLHRYAYPLGRTTRDAGTGRAAAFASFALRHDERIVGFGESFGRLDKTGTTQTLWLQEAFGNAGPASYKQVPFYLSDRGHGVFVHTSNAVRCDVGSREHSALSITVHDADALDWFVLAGRPQQVLAHYTALTGKPSMPPPWSFGFWMGRISYSSQAEVERVAQELRDRRIPTDVIHIDTGWFERDYTCDLRFSPTRFPDPAAMIARLREQGLRVCLWQWPNYNVASPLFDEGVAAGHLARRTSGHTYTFAGGYGEDAGLIDFSSAAAVRWYQDKLTALFRLGVAAIKVDYGEGAPPEARYAGVPATAMHNLYPLLYQDAVWQAADRAGNGEAVLWARAGWAGSQRYPVHWSGDGIARFEDLACVVRGMLSIGLSGFCFYSHDVGGFSGNPSPELYIRWLQLGVFSSHVRAHGSPPREPWEYGQLVEDLSRRYLTLRYRLLPYLLTASADSIARSLPVARALLLGHPEDPVCWQVDDEYLFGPDLLVAPVLEQGETTRRVYLPAGTWWNFWTGEPVPGGRFLTVPAPLEMLPLFVRDGAMIPMGPARQFVGERRCDPLELHFWGDVATGHRRVLTGDDPEQVIDVRWEDAGTLTVDVDGAPGSVEVIVHGAQGEQRRWLMDHRS